jgi:hypothetical protein
MHALALRLLERLEAEVREAARRRRRDRVRRLLLQAQAVVMFDASFCLRSPRYYQCRVHFPTISYWSHIRALPDGVADAAYMMFINYPRFIFDDMAERLRPLLPAFDRNGVRRGRPTLFDVHDILALYLRSWRVSEQEKLSIDFGAPQPRISEMLSIIKPVVAEAVKTWPDAAIRMLTEEEGEAMWQSLVSQHGMPPLLKEPLQGMRFAYSMDGVGKPMLDCSDEEESALWYVHHKGRIMNNLFTWCAWGLICDYSIGWYGCIHDSHAAKVLFDNLQSVELNPGRIGALVDSAFKAYCRSGKDASGALNGDAPVQRPLTNEDVEASEQEYYKFLSALVTTLRQHNEWGNGGECARQLVLLLS